MVSKRKLGSAETERQLALDSDSDGCSSNLCGIEEENNEVENPQPGTSAGGVSSWGPLQGR
jgi:hypothetical protein